MKRRTVLKRPLLLSCLGISTALHMGALWVFFSKPLYFSESTLGTKMGPNPSPSFIPMEKQELLTAKIERALEESLGQLIAVSHRGDLHQDLAQGEISSSPSSSLAPKMSEAEKGLLQFEESEYAASLPPLFDAQQEEALAEYALEGALEEELLTYQTESEITVQIGDGTLEPSSSGLDTEFQDDFTLTHNQFVPEATPLHSSRALSPHLASSLQLLPVPQGDKENLSGEGAPFNDLAESSHPQYILPNSVDYLRNKWTNRSLAERTLPDIEHYELSQIATALEWKEGLDISVEMMPTPDGGKYIFSLSLEPNFEPEQGAMRQNFYFLIDRTSGQGKEKFNRCKRAVQRSLAALREGDLFNILIFDKKISRLAFKSLEVTPRTILQATTFLDEAEGKKNPPAADVYSSFEELLPTQLDPNEMHSVILITDGTNLLKPSKQQELIQKWNRSVGTQVQLYTAAAAKGNDLVLLDLLSYSTGGRILYSDTNASFPRKLVRLIKDLHYPLLKNLSIEIEAKDKHAHVELFPKGRVLPPMFAGQPYRIVGSVDELCDLTVYIQGTNRDKMINIHKEISLLKAAQGGRTLEKGWAEAQAKGCYERYLENGQKVHLKEAVQIVTPHRGIISMGND